MSLPSQSRPTTKRTRFTGRPSKRKNGAPRLGIALAIAVPLSLVAMWWLWPSAGPADGPDMDVFAADAPATAPLISGSDLGKSKPVVQPSIAKPVVPQTIAASPEPSRVSKQALSSFHLRDPNFRRPQQSSQAAAPPKLSASPAQRRSLDMSSGAVQRLVMAAESAEESGRLVESRATFNRALHHPLATGPERQMLRDRLTLINDQMVFSRAVIPGDRMVETYTIRPGDSLSKVVQDHHLDIDWRLVQRINGMSDPRRIRVGQTIKLLRGPFHAVIDKSDYRLDLYSGLVDADGHRLYLRSFRVGLGEFDGTPLGKFVVRPDSKLVNPEWVNPRTGERFASDNPLNPIGERWIGLDGADEATRTLAGYGIHGTIDPQSIGTDASMGCIRMLDEDVRIVYEALVSRLSEVDVTP